MIYFPRRYDDHTIGRSMKEREREREREND